MKILQQQQQKQQQTDDNVMLMANRSPFAMANDSEIEI